MNFEEINEPVSLYDKRYKDEHAQNTADFFEDLVKISSIAPQANNDLVAEINKLNEELSSFNKKRFWQKFLRTTSILAFIAILITGYAFLAPLIISKEGTTQYLIIAGIVCVFGLLIFGFVKLIKVLNGKIKVLDQYIKDSESIINTKTNEAWDQLRPLNSLFEWDTVSKIVMKTLPIFSLDKYFSTARLEQLTDHFGLSGGSHPDNSMLCCQSGALNGNPFVICESKYFEWGTKEYKGALKIKWKEEESYTDSNGNTKYRLVTKTDTLHATIERPYPLYDIEKFLIYGNEAAPDLSFSRTPSSFSGEKGFFSSMSLKRAMKKQESKSRKEGTFTTVGNKEFDATFAANDRDNEVQFRLLFTALGQREMLNILADKSIGFGDDFLFKKSNMINLVQPKHLMDIDISCSPLSFNSYDYEVIKAAFIEYSNKFFKHFYFAFSPILAIPLYQQHRSDIDIYKDVYSQSVSSWDCESIANIHGESKFKHPDSITNNILKVNLNHTPSGTIVDVTAHGFRGEERVDYISKYGGDGNYHNVPVRWVEYLPVQKVSPLVIKEAGNSNGNEYINNLHNTQEWKEFYTKWNKDFDSSNFYKSTISFIPEE